MAIRASVVDIVDDRESLRRVLRGGPRRSLDFGERAAATDVASIVEAVRRAERDLRKHERISWAEKRRAFDLMSFRPYDKQLEIASDPHQIRVLCAGRRSGKSLLAAHEAAATMLMKPGSFGWVMGPWFNLTERVWRMLVDLLKRLERERIVEFEKFRDSGSEMYIRLTNGSAVEGRSADTGDSNQGVGLDWLIQDEVAQMEPWVFTEVVIPAIVQQKGWALLIGTPQQDHWARREASKAIARSDKTGEECIWAEYVFPSWLNTYEFPLGRNDPSIRILERTMERHVFKEQIEAKPQRSPYVVFHEFNEDVHVTSCPFQEDAPVHLSCDPGGTNPYAVLAIQDYGERVEVIDEYYESHMQTFEVINALKRRKWWGNVADCIIDDAAPLEVRAWPKHPDVHFSVQAAKKPHYIEDSLPVVKHWLRDSSIYNALTEPIRDRLVGERYGKAWADLTDEEQEWADGELESLVEDRPDIGEACAHLFFDRFRCENTILEFRNLHVKRPRKEDRNTPEVPLPHRDHSVDAVRYWLWRNKRHWGGQRPSARVADRVI